MLRRRHPVRATLLSLAFATLTFGASLAFTALATTAAAPASIVVDGGHQDGDYDAG